MRVLAPEFFFFRGGHIRVVNIVIEKSSNKLDSAGHTLEFLMNLDNEYERLYFKYPSGQCST